MISLPLCLATFQLVTCFVIPVFLAWTLRPFAPVFRCPLGFLDTREAGICAGSRACFSLLSLLDFSVPVDFCKVIQAGIDQFLVKRR